MNRLLRYILSSFVICGMYSSATKNVLVIDPSDYDKHVLQQPHRQSQYTIYFYDFENAATTYGQEDIYAAYHDIIDRYAHILDGVVCTQDYLGPILAAMVAEKLNLPGPPVQSVLTCQHKYYSRCNQKQAAPSATPIYGLIDPNAIEKSCTNLPMELPCFVKPVKAYFSFGAQTISTHKELTDNILHLLPARSFLSPFDPILQRYGYTTHSDYLIAEQILSGQQVTFEGYIHNGRLKTIGIVDAHMHPNTIAFNQFSYPSSLPRRIHKRMHKIAAKCLQSVGFDEGIFNIEFTYDAQHDAIYIIEINPRPAAQFADLYEKVDGINTYDIMLALATRSSIPRIHRQKGDYAVAASYPLRTFTDKLVTHVPSHCDIQRVHQQFPKTLITIHADEGQLLSQQLQDGNSYLYAIINIGGHSVSDMEQRLHTCKDMLPFAWVETSSPNKPLPSLDK